MKLDTITMDRLQARDAYRAYRAAVRLGGGSPEDALIAKGYHLIAMGKRIISLDAAMRTAGLGNDGFPKCAIARADSRTVHVRMCLDRSMQLWTGDTKTERFDWPEKWVEGRLPESLTKWEDFNRTASPQQQQTWHAVTADAMVPLIPADLRPTGLLKNYHIFFEVEKWTKRTPPPPRDPALLRHIGGDLYAVLAVWDLTELERAVMAGQRIS